MPSGRAHDAVTFILAVPAFAAAYAATGSSLTSMLAAAGFLFGGLMFGPDLDTTSIQYSRWRWLRTLWYPYQKFFPHRSRWSHGLIFGTFFRVVYFAGVVTLSAFLAASLWTLFFGGSPPDAAYFSRTWQRIGSFARESIGVDLLLALFAGMWAGAASHLFTDMAVSYIKTGRVNEFL